MHASSQIDNRGQDVRHVSMTSARSRGRAAIHSSIWRVSASVVELMVRFSATMVAAAIGRRIQTLAHSLVYTKYVRRALAKSQSLSVP
jgi:hypothetical protein